jgi:hypothetical protein
VVVSSQLFHQTRSELLLAYVSSQVGKANPQIDYLLTDWAVAGLPKPSFVRPKLAAIEPSLIVYHVGHLSADDMLAIDNCLRRAMDL